jgi:hypothetical protein
MKGGLGSHRTQKHRKAGENGCNGTASADPNQRLEERMQTNFSTRPVDQVVAAIRALDLDPIKLKLMDPEEGQGWSRDYADRMEMAYRRFLTLLATHPEETLAPCKDIDKFWHGHILDTLKYAEDCERVFGHFLHHFPYFGMRGDEDAAHLARAVETTRRLYRERFEYGPEGTAYCGAIEADSKAYCGAGTQDKLNASLRPAL